MHLYQVQPSLRLPCASLLKSSPRARLSIWLFIVIFKHSSPRNDQGTTSNIAKRVTDYHPKYVILQSIDFSTIQRVQVMIEILRHRVIF